jgi:hypothetical protein
MPCHNKSCGSKTLYTGMCTVCDAEVCEDCAHTVDHDMDGSTYWCSELCLTRDQLRLQEASNRALRQVVIKLNEERRILGKQIEDMAMVVESLQQQCDHSEWCNGVKRSDDGHGEPCEGECLSR